MIKTNKIITTLVFLLLNIIIFAQNNVVDQVVAVVGKNPILKSEIEQQYDMLVAQGYPSGGDLRCQILENILQQKLFLNQAQLDSLEVTGKEIASEIEKRVNSSISQIGSEKKLEEYYGKSILEIKSEFKDVVKEQLLTQKMQQDLFKDVKITPSEVKSFFKTIPKDSLPKINATIEIQQISIYPKIEDEEKQNVRKKLENYRKRVLEDGENFATLAVLYSEDPGSARKGGDLGDISREELVPAFAAAAFRLKKKNEISRIVETNFGFHIIQLIERKGEKIHIRHILLTPKVSIAEKLKAKSNLDSVLTLIRNDSISFDDAAIKFSGDEKTKKNHGIMINRYTGTSKFEYDQIVDPATKYTVKNIEQNKISDVFETKDMNGKSVYRILVVKNKIDQHTASLKIDYKHIQDMALASKKQKKLDAWISEKIRKTYIHIDESLTKCEFKNTGWVK